MTGVTKCDRKLLQNVTGITKCDNYNKVRHNNDWKQVQNLAYLMSFSKEHIKKSSIASNSPSRVHFSAYNAFVYTFF